jgi:predicted transcriptional regulator
MRPFVNTTLNTSMTKQVVANQVPLRELRALMILKDLSVTDVAKAARVPYNTTSGILTGRIIQPGYLQRIIKAIQSAPELQAA